MNGKYDKNIKMLLTFTYSKEPEKIINYIKNNGCGPSIKGNALNRFKSLLGACAVAGGLNRELISHLSFHSNKYICEHLDDDEFQSYK